MEDHQIVELYWARAESAVAETERQYRRYCHYIAYQILGNDADAEEIVNDTWLKVWGSIPPNRPQSLKAYVGMISRQLSFNAYEKKHAHGFALCEQDDGSARTASIHGRREQKYSPKARYPYRV